MKLPEYQNEQFLLVSFTRVLTNFWTEDFLPAQPVYAEPVQILWKMAVLFTV